MAGSARVGSRGTGFRVGGADRTSGVDTAGTVAKIDLRLPHHSDCEVASADPVRPLGSFSGDSRPSGLRGCEAALGTACPSYVAPMTATVRCVSPSYQQRAPRAAAPVAMGRLPGNRSRAEAQ